MILLFNNGGIGTGYVCVIVKEVEVKLGNFYFATTYIIMGSSKE